MRITTLLLKVLPTSVCLYTSMGSSFFLCGLLLKSLMGQLLVGCASHKAYIICICLISVHVYMSISLKCTLIHS